MELNIRIATNIAYFLREYKEKKIITGKCKAAIEHIRKGKEEFEDNRSKIKDLKQVTIHPFTDEKGIENSQVYVVKIRGKDVEFVVGRGASTEAKN